MIRKVVTFIPTQIIFPTFYYINDEINNSGYDSDNFTINKCDYNKNKNSKTRKTQIRIDLSAKM